MYFSEQTIVSNETQNMKYPTSIGLQQMFHIGLKP
jgi:hypothetical protein